MRQHFESRMKAHAWLSEAGYHSGEDASGLWVASDGRRALIVTHAAPSAGTDVILLVTQERYSECATELWRTAEHFGKRVTELLKANNREVERRRAAEAAKLRYVNVTSIATSEQSAQARATIYPFGDCLLLWVNEGDLCDLLTHGRAREFPRVVGPLPEPEPIHMPDFDTSAFPPSRSAA